MTPNARDRMLDNTYSAYLNEHAHNEVAMLKDALAKSVSCCISLWPFLNSEILQDDVV